MTLPAPARLTWPANLTRLRRNPEARVVIVTPLALALTERLPLWVPLPPLPCRPPPPEEAAPSAGTARTSAAALAAIRVARYAVARRSTDSVFQCAYGVS